MLKAIFFDLDGTIRHNSPSGGEVFADYARQLGLLWTEEDRMRAARWEHFYWANSWELLEDRRLYEADLTEFWHTYSRRELVALGATAAQAIEWAPQIHAYMTEAYKPTSVVPEDARRALPLLRQAGYKMAVISNRSKPYQEEMEALELAPYFSFALAGGEINSYKPGPEIFHHACKRLRVKPKEAAYVGDNFYADILGARRGGLTPVLYDRRGVFPDPGCATIKSFDELEAALAKESAISKAA
ncbi:MAG: HAD family hydrolase [Anaerolineales bacterium]